MKFKGLFILFIVMIFGEKLKAQDPVQPVFPKLGKQDTIQVASTNDNGVMIPWMQLQDVSIFANRIWKSPAEKAAYNRLRYNVLKVMPYAIFAKRRYEQLEQDIARTPEKREQKKLVKQCDKEIKDMFNREIKELTITQGQILTKLIDRESWKNNIRYCKTNKRRFCCLLLSNCRPGSWA
ncbi:DUF4294 domain-containing protein [Pedobacter agri]|uniref:DUF4294 domain-containing protein n=1 Tax=Pedobacter agri TaxID=454586 RepID=UPI002783AB23|nr:DUF4294 domain-containing protein [Pedobacter agri]MDQ1139752.1 hypothetical protein [Pedobacter agri]